MKSPSNVVSVYEGSNWMMNDSAWANLGSYGCYLPGTYLANNVDRSNVLSGDALSDYNTTKFRYNVRRHDISYNTFLSVCKIIERGNHQFPLNSFLP